MEQNKRFCPIKMLVIVHIIFHLKGCAETFVTIGHIRVPNTLPFNTRLSANPFFVIMNYICMKMLTLQTLIFKLRFLFTVPIQFNRSSWENLLKYQLDSSSLIMYSILMTTLFSKALIL